MIVFRPASGGDFQRIYELDCEAFQANELIPKETFEAWQLRNGNTFWVGGPLARPDTVTAYYSLLFLAPGAFQAFKMGEIAEDQLTAGDLLNPSQALSSEEVYVFSVMSSAPKGSRERRALMVALLKHLSCIAANGVLNTVYATVATADGLALFEKAVAQGICRKVQGAERRVDKHTLYCFDASPSAFARWAHLRSL